MYTILLVENENWLAQSKLEQLQENGFVAKRASSREEAMAIINAAQPLVDLILIDINPTPGLDGLETAQILLQEHDLPLVLLTSDNNPDLLTKAEQMTAYGCLEKSVDVALLAAQMKMALNLHGQKKEMARRVGEQTAELEQVRLEHEQVKADVEESERFRQVVMERVSDGFVLVELVYDDSGRPCDNRLMSANRAFEEQFGLNVEKLIRSGSSEFLPNIGQIWFDIQDEVLRTGESRRGEIFDKTTSRYFDVLIFPYGRNIFGQCYHDITALKRAERALRESEHRFRMVLDSTQDAINLLDLKTGQYIFMNPAQIKLTGFSAVEMQSFPVEEAFGRVHPDDRQISINQQEQIAAGIDSPETVEYRWKVKSGEYRWFSDSRRLIQDENGQAVALMGISHDITDRKLADANIEYIKRLNNALADGVFTVKLPERVIEYVNDAVVKNFGYTEEEIIGQTTELFYPKKEDYLRFGRNLREAIGQGYTVVNVEQQLKRKNGELFFAEITTTFLMDEGVPTGVISIVRDITERKQAEQSLRENEENLRITLNSIGEGVISTDVDGRITRMNPVAEVLTGWEQAEALGEPLSKVFSIIDSRTREVNENLVANILKAGKVDVMPDHTLLISKTGHEYQTRYSGIPMRDEEGNIMGVVLVFRDVTEQLRMSQELIKVEKLESVGILAGGIAHDFNNLLTGLFTNIELAKMTIPSNHRAYKYLEAGGYTMDTAVNLTNQLLTFAKGGSPIKETVSIGRVIADSADFVMHGSSARLQMDVAPDLWLVDADKGQLTQVISNVVINAQQAMPKGGTITITAENSRQPDTSLMPSGRYVKIAIQDEGLGIPPENIDQIFDPYFTTKPKGSGLGLASAHAIVNKHNGLISVDSQPNKGTTFTIYLPALDKEEREAAATRLTGPLFQSGHLVRVLVMDDEPYIRDAVEDVLTEVGYMVDKAIDGEDAVAKYTKAHQNGGAYDVVITDLTIPGGKGGQDAAMEILEIHPEAKIIVSSGYAIDPVMADYKAYGFKGVVVKPYKITELQKVINQVLMM